MLDAVTMLSQQYVVYVRKYNYVVFNLIFYRYLKIFKTGYQIHKKNEAHSLLTSIFIIEI